ncbi:alpha-amylase family protein [Corynebacterium choanae]|uniref:Neopullulanase n=1 Tax=Corynebacterium choanae TaxID=1862358 RepID=A0A3G6J505_9CORY|nr:alpha-amylase family protein [Corynebacterium choanae]AZA13117.1 Neopullulanase [Corynebacterium choanae]
MSDVGRTPIAWQVYPLGFTGAPVRPNGPEERQCVHRLGHLNEWLDYVVEMGCNMLILGPIFSADTHGYDTLDFFAIDPRLGDEQDFDALAQGCSERGIQLVLDGVFNHVAASHELVQTALAHGQNSSESELFRIDFAADPPRPAVFEGHESLVSFNHDSAAVADLVVEVMCYWAAKGVAGWRLDAVYAIDPDFWPGVLERVRDQYPDVFIFGEMIHGDYVDYVQRSTIDSVTQYELWKACWSALRDENFFELQWTLQRHNALLETFVPITFVGNHDTSRIASQVGDSKAVLAATLLFTLPGHPVVYYGDELGWHAHKEEKLGGDDAVRPMFPANPAQIEEHNQWMLSLYRELIALRRNFPQVTNGRVYDDEVSNTRLVYHVDDAHGQRVFDVELDVTERPTARVWVDGEQRFSWEAAC